MSDAWAAAIKFVLDHEGGYVNDPADPGGETNMGISKRSYPHEDIRHMTVARAEQIYRSDFWDALNLSGVNPQVAVVLMDTAVNMGIPRTRTYQRLGGWVEMLAARAHDYVTFQQFHLYGLTWLRRVRDLYLLARSLETST